MPEFPYCLLPWLVVQILGLFISTELSAQSYDDLLLLARSHDPYERNIDGPKDVDTAVAYYRMALATFDTLPPESMPVKVRMGGLLLFEKDDERERLLEGMRIFEEVLTDYDYMDYYIEQPYYGSEEVQYRMLSVAIHAGETRQYTLGDLEAARAHYFHAMRLLSQTYQKRREDWRTEPKPVRVPDFYGGRNPEGKYQMKLEDWQERQDRAESGAVFRELQPELTTVRALVRKYGETFGRTPPDKVRSVLQPILDEFPGTPFETHALEIIEKAEGQVPIEVVE